MNRLKALKYFIVAAQNLSFKQTAEHFSLSPQVISRVIAELENELGEQLFKRNTRAICLTDFGAAFLPKAIRFLQEEEQLFTSQNQTGDQPEGLVRITLPPYRHSDQVLQQLLNALAPYPNIRLDWRTDFDILKTVDDQIDIGVRISRLPNEHWIAKKISNLNEPIVASPGLIAQTGLPHDIFDLVENFPVGNVRNPDTDKAWDWFIGQRPIALPAPALVVSDIKSLLPAVLAGRIFAPIIYPDCQPYLDNGELQIVLPNSESAIWNLYLYRPYQTITAKRVLVVFELLEEILKQGVFKTENGG